MSFNDGPITWWSNSLSRPDLEISDGQDFGLISIQGAQVNRETGTTNYFNSQGQLFGQMSGLTPSEADFLHRKHNEG